MSQLAHFTGRDSKAQRGKVTCTRPHSKVVAETGREHRSLGFQATTQASLSLLRPFQPRSRLAWAGLAARGPRFGLSQVTLVPGMEEAGLADPTTWGV